MQLTENTQINDNPLFNLASLVTSLLGNFLLAGTFVASLIFPLKFKDFILNLGPLIVALEFFSYRAVNTIIKIEKYSGFSKAKFQFNFLFVYIVLAVIISAVFKNWILPFYFVISLLLKVFGINSANKDFNRYLPAFFIAIILTIVIAGFLRPFPLAITSHESAGIKSAFVGNYQFTLLWGSIYFGLIFIKDFFDFINNKKKRRGFFIFL